MKKTVHVMTEEEEIRQKSLELIKQVDEMIEAFFDFHLDLIVIMIEEDEEMFKKLGKDLLKSLSEFKSVIISYEQCPRISIDSWKKTLDEVKKIWVHPECPT